MMKAEVDAENPKGRSPAPRQRVLALALGLLAAAGIVVAILLGASSPSPKATENTGSVTGAATVQRRNLVETDTESGTLGYVDPQIVYDRLSGTITWLPGVGQVIDPGQTLYSVDGRAVVLLNGALAAYRALSAKDGPGQDILQLNSDLVQMGFADGQITIDHSWQAGTTDAVKRWQASLGEKQTGKITLGRIVFLPGPQRVTQLETTCGSTGSGGGPSSGSDTGPTNGCGISDVSTTAAAPHTEFIDEFTTSSSTTTQTTAAPTTTSSTPTTTTTSTSSMSTTSTSRTSTNAKSPSGQRTSRSRNDNHGGGNASGGGKKSGGAGNSSRGSARKRSSVPGSGSSAGSASPILQTTSTRLAVTVDLAASSQGEAVVGSHVTVEMPNSSTVGGTITAVSAVAQSSSNSNGNSGAGGESNDANGGGGSAATIPVTITLDHRVKGVGLDQASVSVDFTQAGAKNVLSVPVTALVATSGQSYAVQEASPPYKLLPVTTGLFAAGYVEISGAGVHPGLQVTDSQG